MKKRILITAGGTAAAWHLASLASTSFAAHYDLFVCDINPPHLIPASRLAQRYFQVPLIEHPAYRSHMLQLLTAQRIDIFVPLIDFDLHRFPADDPDLASLGVHSTGISIHASALLRSKRKLAAFLQQHSFAVPEIISLPEIASQPARSFFIKPEQGFGSRGARSASGEDVLRALVREPGLLVQELCLPPEVTVEVFNRKIVRTLCRERLETKAGVCTKARIFHDPDLHAIAERLCRLIELPPAFCFQVMTGPAGNWLITDLNPRLGAGTALSTACGWSLASAALACYGDLPLDPTQYLSPLDGEHHVVRVFQELVMN